MNSQKTVKPVFDDVLEEYYRYVLKFVAKQVNDIEDAKDLTQEIFVKAYNNYKRYEPRKGSVKTWLFTIANNHIINFWKSAYQIKRYTFKFDFDLIAAGEDILERVIQEEDSRIIQSLMERHLNKRNQKIMNLYFYSELTPHEIAELLEMNSKTISNVISLSIKKIKGKLEDQL